MGGLTPGGDRERGQGGNGGPGLEDELLPSLLLPAPHILGELPAGPAGDVQFWLCLRHENSSSLSFSPRWAAVKLPQFPQPA